MSAGGGPPVPLARELNWSTLAELEGVTILTKVQGQTISVCQTTLNTCSMAVEFKDTVMCMEWNINHMAASHCTDNHKVPCAVCFAATRDTILMIPAKLTCPTNWTLEYTGYLMTEHYTHRRSTYECVDKDAESVPGLDGSSDIAFLYHVEPICGGLSCPPYDAQKELTCVVCSR